MIGYASLTTNRKNLAALRVAGWRLMRSPKSRQTPGEKHLIKGFRYALDNGAWHAFAHQRPFDADAFVAAYHQLGAGADFVVLPDLVAGGLASLAFSLSWREKLGTALCPLLLAVQDGMTIGHVAPLVGPSLGIFVGGSSAWKEQTMAAWGQCAKASGAYFHVGRVNTRRRIYLSEAAGADSFDGSSVSRYAVNMPLLDNARKQSDLFSLRSLAKPQP